MKKIKTIMIALTTIILFIMITIMFDYDQSNTYTKIPHYEYKYLTIEDNTKVDKNLMYELINLASKYRIVIRITIYNNSDDTLLVYTTEEYNDLIKRIDVPTKYLNNSYDSDSFVATYNTNQKEQYAVIKDFLNNNRYKYYSMNQFIDNGENLTDDYLIFYRNIDDYNQFISEAKNIITFTPDSNVVLGSPPTNLVLLALILTMVLYLIFYFIINVFDIYNRGNEIGTLRLLGYKNNGIFWMLSKDSLRYYLIIDSIWIIVSFFIKNTSIKYIVIQALFVIIFTIVTIVVTYFSVVLIANKYSISDIIKDKQISKSVGRLASIFKVIVSSLIIVVVGSLLMNYFTVIKLISIRKKSNQVLDYSVITHLGVYSDEYREYEKYNVFYQKLEDSDIDYYYSDFHYCYGNYNNDYSKTLIENKEFYPIAFVDQNYLNKIDIEIFDSQGILINASDYPDQELFLIPLSKKDDLEYIANYYQREFSDVYEKRNVSMDFQYFFYKDQMIPTLRQEVTSISSPIMHVINDKYVFNYFTDKGIGLMIAGNGYDTGLVMKIDTSNIDELMSIVKDCGLSKTILKHNIRTINSKYTTELNQLSKTLSIDLITVSIFIFINLLISYQYALLITDEKRNEIVIKYLLGFKIKDSIKESQNNYLILSVLSIIIAAIVYYFVIRKYYIYLLLSIIVNTLIDLYLSRGMLINIQRHDVIKQIKGGA